MLIAEDEGAELHDGNEAGEIEDLGVGVATVEDAGEIEELRTLVYLCPKALLECFFGRTEGGSLLNEIEVGKDSDDFGETMGL